ncbi:hypothetical protein D3C86_2081340 [compost metagenome]
MLVAVGAANLNAQRCGRFEVQRRIAHATGDQQLEVWQPAQQVLIEPGAFTHYADHLKAAQALGQSFIVGGVIVHKTDLANAVQH